MAQEAGLCKKSSVFLRFLIKRALGLCEVLVLLGNKMTDMLAPTKSPFYCDAKRSTPGGGVVTAKAEFRLWRV